MLEIYEMPGHLIRRLNQVSVSLFMEETSKKGFDLTPVQYAALSAIDTRPGLDQATLANHIAYDRVTIGGVVDRLVQKDLVRRETNAKDRRARELYLTDKGKQTLKDIRPIVWHMQTLLLEGLDEKEREVFVALLRKAADAGNEMSRAPLRL
ncbi:MarR family transcriptional regulator [Rhizobium sp. RU36D]|uniref:MarR family winged helix-turn-helix transcriptional regulator n=1 Tax=Rhizobium sp. RU36D TaxID=1907415 RepID=UPI0009D846E6|nr:MarR family transcriptional regulator [Rhizobium sp. RU36D]SMC42883.1 transcriptional regulator, MarR family [Rhizobium sp. RU36D]